MANAIRNGALMQLSDTWYQVKLSNNYRLYDNGLNNEKYLSFDT